MLAFGLTVYAVALVIIVAPPLAGLAATCPRSYHGRHHA